MRRVVSTGIGLTVLVAIVLVAGGTVAGAPVDDQGPPDQADTEWQSPADSVTPAGDGLGPALNNSEVGIELRPANASVDPGENLTYDVVITGPDNGLSAYGFNVSVGDTSVAEIDGFSLDREPLVGSSFITSDNSTVVFDVALGDNKYAPTAEVTAATINVTATGTVGDSTMVDFIYDPEEAILDNDNELYNVTEEQSATLDIGSLPEFQVSNLDPAEASVVAGETINVSADVENIGGAGTQTVSLDIGGYSENTTLTLAGGANETVTFEGVDTGALGPGSYEHTISSENETVSGNLTVLSDAAFAVDIVETTAPVEGENLTVTVAAENTGDVTGTQTVTLDVGALGDDATNVTLDGGNTTETVLSVGTGAGDAGEYTATVSSADDSATANVTVDAPALFDVTLTGVDEAVAVGETVTVAYEVENTGDVGATQAIDFAVNGTTEDSESGVTLNGSETFSGQFSYETVDGDAPAVDVTVSSEDDSATETVVVNEPAVFEVTVSSVDDAVVEGETVTVAYEVENTGGVQATQAIDFTVNGTSEDSESGVTLNGSETFSGQFSYETVDGDAPAVTVAVSSEDDSATETVVVNEPAVFEVTISSVDDAVVEGETVTVAYEVENTGGVQATQAIEFAVNGTMEDSESGVTLNGSETFSGQFSYETVDGDAPAVTVAVSSEDDSATETVVVNEPAVFEVTITSIDETATEGDSIAVAYEVTNAGDAGATQTIDFTVNGTSEDSESGVTLNGSETFSGQFSYGTVSGDAPAVDVTVSSEDDSATEMVVVNEPAVFEVTIPSVNASVTVGDTIVVSYEVTNTGDVGATQDIGFAVNGTTEDTENGVTLNGSETFGGQFSYETVAGDVPAVTVAVSSEDDSASETVAVNEPPVFTVEIVATNAALVAGEQLNVTVDVENVGGGAGTRPLQVDAGPLGDAERSIDLAGGESTEETFVFNSTTEQTGTYNVTADVGDETVMRQVELTPTPVPGSDNTPGDPDGNGQYENVDGDDSFDIFDVQTFFTYFDTEVIQQHTPAFDFNDDGDVTIFDVQNLFELLGEL